MASNDVMLIDQAQLAALSGDVGPALTAIMEAFRSEPSLG